MTKNIKSRTALHQFLLDRWYVNGKNDVDFASAIGVDPSLISHWKRGVQTPTLNRKVQIGKILDVDSRIIFPDDRKGR